MKRVVVMVSLGEVRSVGLGARRSSMFGSKLDRFGLIQLCTSTCTLVFRFVLHVQCV